MKLGKSTKILLGGAATFLSGGLALLAAMPPSTLLPITAPATAKREQLWNRIEASAYSDGELPTAGPGALDLAKLLYTPFLQVTFTNTSDEMPLERKRVIHTYGTIAKVRFESDRISPFTGLFQSGGEGLIRLSLAAQGGAFTPGFGLKILVDGKPSVNFQAMYSLEGQGDDHNFFAHTFTNIVDPPKSFALRIGAQAFASAIACLPGAPENERTLPLEQAAAVNASGRATQNFVAPYRIEFWPTAAAAAYTPSQDDVDMRERIAQIPAGTTLYDVTATTRDGVQFWIGRVVTESRFIASRYGDETIFFQHQSKVH